MGYLLALEGIRGCEWNRMTLSFGENFDIADW
jgi:hypothetical protein